MNDPLERDVQKAVADYLGTLGLTFIHVVNEQMLFSVLPDDRSHALYRELTDRGYSPGFPDLLIFDRPPQKPERKGMALELKRASGSKADLSDNQEEWLKRLKRKGWLVGVGYGVDDAMEKLERAGYG